MSVVIVSKSGQSLTTRASGRKNPRGEQMGTEDLIKHLCDIGHRVVYFGNVDDSLTTKHVVRPNTSGIHQMMTNKEQQERFAGDEALLKVELDKAGHNFKRPPLWIEMCGMPASCSFVNNPRGIQPQMSSMRYTAPMLGVMHRMGSPRISVVADVRSYPRDAEMSDGWPNLMPAALLDNYQGAPREKRQKIAFKGYLLRSVNSKSYSWGDHEWREPQEICTWYVGGVSHCHVTTGFKKKRRSHAWDAVLGSQGDVFKELDFDNCVMYGEGWEGWDGYGYCKDVFKEPTDWYGVQKVLQESVVSPVVAPEERFVTNKPYIIAAAGCLPALASGVYHEWDPAGWIVPDESPLRCLSWNDTVRLAKQPLEWRREILESLKESMRPDFSVIDQLIEDHECQIDQETWWSRYGGYRST